MTLASMQYNFRRGQIGSYIELCNSLLEGIVDDASSDPIDLYHVQGIVESLEVRLFSKKRKLDDLDLSKLGYINQKYVDEFCDIIGILKGDSLTYPLPEYYVDGAGEEYEELTQRDKDEIKREIQNSVAIKIKNLSTEIIAKLESDDERTCLTLTKKESIRCLKRVNRSIFSYFSDECKMSPDVAAFAIATHPNNLAYSKGEINKFHHIVLSACIQKPELFEFADESIRSDPKFVLRLIRGVKTSSDVIFRLSGAEVRDDFLVGMEAIKNNPNAYYYLSERLSKNRDISFYLARHYPQMIDCLPSSILTNQKFLRMLARANEKSEKKS